MIYERKRIEVEENIRQEQREREKEKGERERKRCERRCDVNSGDTKRRCDNAG